MTGARPCGGDGGADAAQGWLAAVRRYLVAVALGNLVWEFAQMPLYTLWRTGAAREVAFAALHCTAGDILIATAALVASLVVVGTSEWPRRRFARVAAAVTVGLGYTVYSEHMNVVVRAAWAYSDLMPTVPWLGTGLAPLAQWVVVPALSFAWARRPSPKPPGSRRAADEAAG